MISGIFKWASFGVFCAVLFPTRCLGWDLELNLVSFVLSFFPRDVLDGILNLIGSVSEGFPSYSSTKIVQLVALGSKITLRQGVLCLEMKYASKSSSPEPLSLGALKLVCSIG